MLTRRLCEAEALAERGAQLELELKREIEAREEAAKREALLGACVEAQRAELEEARYELSIGHQSEEAIMKQKQLIRIEGLEHGVEDREQQLRERQQQLEEADTVDAELQRGAAALIHRIAPIVKLLMVAATRNSPVSSEELVCALSQKPSGHQDRSVETDLRLLECTLEDLRVLEDAVTRRSALVLWLS